MIKKTIKYVDYNGNEIEEDFYFNLTEAEIMEMQLEQEGGLSTKLETIVKTKDVPTIIKVFKDLVLRSYGKKSDDGKRFIKNKNIREEFEQSPAYSVLFMELATDSDAAANFVNGIIPQKVAQSTQKVISQK